MARRYDEWPGEDYTGSSARGAMKGWHKHGVCAEAEWRYEADVAAAGGLTEAIILSNRSLFFYTMSGPGGGTVWVVGPWLIYTVMALIFTVLFFLLTLRLARPTRAGRRKPKAA